MPGGLRKVLERAIQARQRCAEWFRTSKLQNKYSDEGHQHFIDVLKSALEILETRNVAATKEKNDPANSKNVEEADAFLHGVTNRFEVLGVEDTVNLEDLEAISAGGDIFELEYESEEMKMSLMIFCLFEDLHRIQDFLHGIWKSFKAKTLDLVTATIITNTAFDLVHRNEEEILAAMFSGQLPESMNEAYVRYGKTRGLSAGISARNAQSHPWYGLGVKWTDGKEQEPQYDHLGISEIFRPFFDGKSTFEACLIRLEPLVQAGQQLGTKHKRRNARRKLTPLQFLVRLQEFLPPEVSKLQFDYISLTKRCYMLLKQIHARIGKKLNIVHPLLNHSESTQPMYAIMVFKILKEANEIQGAGRQGRDPLSQSPQLEIAGNVLNRFWKSGHVCLRLRMDHNKIKFFKFLGAVT